MSPSDDLPPDAQDNPLPDPEDQRPSSDGDPQPLQPNQHAYETLDDADRPSGTSTTETELETQTPGGISEAHDPYAAWRFRNFRFYTAGSFAWWIGRQMLGIVVGWQVYALTNSKAALGLVGLVEALPLLALALPAGHLADRLNRRNMTILMTAVIAMCSLSLAAVSHQSVVIPEWSILMQANGFLDWTVRQLGETNVDFTNPVVPILYLLFCLTGAAQAFGGPSRAALLPSIIPIEHYSNAATWNSSIAQISSMGGPALGGFLLALFSGKSYAYSAIYLLESACIILFILALCNIHYVHRVTPKKDSPVKNVIAGLRFVFNRKIILATITLDMFAVLLGGAVILLPVYAKDILQVGPWGFGWLRAAPAIGAFVMALSLAHLPPMKKAGRTLLWSVAGFGVATIVFGYSTSFWLSLIALALTGAFDNVSVVVRHTLVQVLTPDAMRGRVSSVNNIFIGSSNELGSFRAGTSAALFGPVMAVVGGGVCTVLVAMGVWYAWPQVRQFGSLKDARPDKE